MKKIINEYKTAIIWTKENNNQKKKDQMYFKYVCDSKVCFCTVELVRWQPTKKPEWNVKVTAATPPSNTLFGNRALKPLLFVLHAFVFMWNMMLQSSTDGIIFKTSKR